MRWTQSYTSILSIVITTIGSVLVVLITQIVSRKNLASTITQLQSNHSSELNERKLQQKREAYANLLASLEEMTESFQCKNEYQSRRFHEASVNMNTSLAIIDVLAPMKISAQAEIIEDYVEIPRGAEEREQYLNILTNMMRDDLGLPDKFKVDRIRGGEERRIR